MNHIGSAVVVAAKIALPVTAACNERASGTAPQTSASPAAARGCNPLETRSANAPEQRPERPDQTRACAAPASAAFDVTVVAKGLVKPWAVEPLPGGDLLVTEKEGRLRIISAAGMIGEPIAGLPAVDARRQGGLLDVALGPAFDSDRTIYWSFSEPRQGGNATSVARGTLSQDRRRVEGVKVIFRARSEEHTSELQSPCNLVCRLL